MSAVRWSALALLVTAGPALAAPDPGAVPESSTVVSVYDGDTVTLATGHKVRLRLVNTPELRPPEQYGIEARDATAALTLHQEVTLVYGETKVDGYGRLLAGVRVGDQDLATHLLELGYGHLFVIPPDTTDLAPLLAAQQKAKDAKRGIWSTDRYQGTFHITSFHANADGDDRENVNGEYLRICNVTREPVDMNGYRITDLSGRSWTLPAVVVPAGHTVQLRSGVGTNQTDPASQLELFLGNADPIWNNKRDRATIYDRFGRVVDTRLHEVKG